MPSSPYEDYHGNCFLFFLSVLGFLRTAPFRNPITLYYDAASAPHKPYLTLLRPRMALMAPGGYFFSGAVAQKAVFVA